MTDPLVAAGYAVVTLLSVAVLWRSLRARPRPGAAWLALVMSGVTWWSALSVGLALTDDLLGPVGTLLGRLEWFGITVIAVGFVRFGLAMSGRDEYLSNRAVAGLLAVPFAWTVVGLAHAQIIDLAATTVPPVATVLRALVPLVPLYVWLNPVVVAGVYLALAVGTALLLETAFERPAAEPRRTLTLVMVVPPWTLNVLYLAGLTPTGGYDPTVLGFVVSGLAGVAAIDRFGLFETPFVRSEVVEELDTPVAVFGADDRLYDYNERAASVLELTEADLDETLGAVFERSPLSVDLPLGASTPTVAERLDGTEVTAGTRENADERHYLVTTTELTRGDGRRLGYAVQCSDVTRQHRQQERIREKSRRLERKNEQLERLAGIVAHDMETPVATGRRLLDLLRIDLDASDEELARSLDDLDRVFARLEGFAEHLPRLARESVDVESTVECDLETVARDAWRVVETGDLRLTVVDTTTLDADPRRLGQVFENLFRNVVEHGTATAVGGGASPDPAGPDGREGGGRSADGNPVGDETGPVAGGEPVAADPGDGRGARERALDRVADGDATVVRVGTLGGGSGTAEPTACGFYVEDDGPGIPDERRDDVFSFGAGDATGYGLAIVRTIVEAHGWSVRVTAARDPHADASGEAGSKTEEGGPGARFEIDTGG